MSAETQDRIKVTTTRMLYCFTCQAEVEEIHEFTLVAIEKHRLQYPDHIKYKIRENHHFDFNAYNLGFQLEQLHKTKATANETAPIDNNWEVSLPYKCYKCSAQFSNWQSYRAHKQEKHSY